MTRMLALVGDAYGASGGIAQYNRDIFDALVRLGGRDVVILPRHGQAVPTTAGVVQRAAMPGRFSYALRALRVALATRPAVIFCGHLFMAPLAALLARLTGAKLLVQLHGIEGWQRPNARTCRAIAASHMVLCVSRDTRKKFLAWSDLPPERAVVASNTVRSAFTPGDKASARSHLGLGAQKIMLSVGRIDKRERYKGQDRVIAALPALARSGLDPLFLIAGDGDDRTRLASLAQDHGAAMQVQFLGNVDDETLVQLYRAADLFVLPSTGEGFGIVFLEAMACGTPALGLAAGGAPDPLCDGALGTMTVEARLPEKLLELLSSPVNSDLSAEVTRRFGEKVFTRRIADLMARLDTSTRLVES
jgi:phosphatidylinositol alpha-1,6-mannosyltransferase